MKFTVNGRQYSVDEFADGHCWTEWINDCVASESESTYLSELDAQIGAIEHATKEPEDVFYDTPHWSTRSWL